MPVRNIGLLPEIFRTNPNEKFINATIEQLTNEPNLKRVNGYIGKKFTIVNQPGDNYIDESTNDRDKYQLEPAVVVPDVDGKPQFTGHYVDLLNKLRFYGADTTNQTRLFSNDYYSYDSQIAYDKFVNFSQYYWLPTGPVAIDIFSEVLPVNTSTEVTRIGSSATVATGVGNYQFDRVPNQTNPLIILSRNGTYNFEVDQAGNPFWIQTEAGTSGMQSSQPNFSTREIHGVVNNGEDDGTITFNVPDANAQSFFTDMTDGVDINFANSGITYEEIQGSLLSEFLATYGGIDDNVDISGKTLMFVDNDADPLSWTATNTYTTGMFGGTEYGTGILVPAANRVGIWQVNLEASGGDYIIHLTSIALTVANIKHKAIEGVQYNDRSFYKDGSSQVQLIPLITALQDTFYYQDGNDENLVGIIKLVNVGETFVIDIAEDILGMPSYTSPNGIKFTNGMKVRFNEFVSPATYADNEYYVEGVGEAITLTAVTSLVTPEDYVINALEPWDSTGFDTTGYEGGNDSPTVKDYITINRASIDLNPWSRSNRWFHIDVLREAAAQGGFELLLESDSRANRPIIEFNANLKLFNFGLVGVAPIDLQDTTETDALSNVHGSLAPLEIDGIDVKEGMRVVFLNDEDPVVRKTIYTVGFIDADNDTVLEVNLVPDSMTLEEGNTFLVSNGLVWQGNTLYLQNELLVSSQAKTNVNQQPLFDVYDLDGNKLSDTSAYVNSSFRGTELFSYAVGTGGNDVVLGFPLSYRNFQSVGDIIFNNNFDADTFSFTTDDITNVSNINIGLLHKTTSLTTYTRHNTWRTIAETSSQHQLFTYDNNGTSLYRIDVAPIPESFIKHYHVYVDHVELTRDQFQFTTQNDFDYIEILIDIDDVNKIDILLTSKDVSALAIGYEVPVNLENNAQNNSFSNLTLGQIRNHVGNAYNNSNRVTGVFPGNSDLRDLPFTMEAGGDILQHSAGLPYSNLFLLDKTSNFIDSVTHAQAEYARFKYKFTDLATKLDIDVLDTIKATDQIIAFINDVKTSDFPWYASDMVPYGDDTTITEYDVTQIVNRDYELVTLFDNTTVSNKAALVYVNNVQLVSNIDFLYNSEFPRISILDEYPLVIGDVIKIVEYSNTDGNWIPETPSKMGLYPAFAPARIVDDAFVNNTEVIRGHDGSVTPVYGDFRDDLLLELEKRIFNNIKTPYDERRLSINSIKPGKFRETDYTLEEFNNTLARYFYKFVGENKLDYRNDPGFDPNDSFTYNYRKFGDKIDNSPLQGYCKAVYNYYYDTIHPNTRPWEMLGFSARPLWWVDTYGPAPYTSGNLILWEDLELGKVAAGDRAGIDPVYARPGLTDIIPVDAFGTLLSPNEFLVNGTAVQYANEPYIAGEEGPVETSWRNSSQFPYAMQIIIALLKPAEYFGLFADLQEYNFNTELDQFLFEPTNQRLTQQDIMLNGEVTNGVTERTASYINWIVDFIKSDNVSPTSYLGNILDKFTINLAYKVAGFTDKKLLKVIAEQSSPSSTSASVIIPDEDFHVSLNTTAPLIRVSYSSVIVEKVSNGYRVDGYNLGNPHFTILPSIENRNTSSLTVLDETVTLFKSFSTQPVSIPYGFVFDDTTALVDFLVGYQRFLERQGFLFNVYDPVLVEVKNWLMSAKEYLYWTQQGWDAGNVIVLNPTGDKVHMNTPGAVVGEIKQQSPHAIADQNFQPIPDQNFTVKRIDNEFQLEVQDGRAIGFLEITLIQFEHVLVFNNITVFNDVIYQAELGNRQLRLKLVGQISNNWNGALAPSGYIYNDGEVPAWQQQKDYRRGDIVTYKSLFYVANNNLAGAQEFDYSNWSVDNFGKFNDGLIPNYSNLARVPEDFYEINNVNLESQTDLFGKGLIGFRRREYFDQLGLDDTSQIKFYQGMIQKKGTISSVQAMTRARLRNDDSDIALFEEWALRVGAYGATDSTAFIETRLDEGSITSNPVLLTFKNSGDAATIDAENIYPNDVHATSRSYDKELFLNQEYELGLDFTVKTAGTPILTDAEYKLFSWDDFDSLQASIYTAGIGQLVWVAKEGDNDWNIYRIAGTNLQIRTVTLSGTTYEMDTNTFHELVVGDRILVRGIDALVDAWYVVSGIKDLNTFYVETAVDSSDFEDVDTTLVSGQLYKLVSNRVADSNAFIDIASIAIEDGEKIYIDQADADENWSVIEKGTPWDYNSRTAAQLPQDQMNFGNTVAMSSDSLLVFVGAPAANSGVGSVNIATRNNLGIFNTTATLKPTHITNMGYGTSVDTDDGTHMIVGAPLSGPAGNENTGYVYVYEANSAFQSGYELVQILVPEIEPLVPSSLMGYISDNAAYETEVWAFEVTTGGNFRIGAVVQDQNDGAFSDSDNVVAVYNQSGVQIPVDGPSFNYGGTIIDNTFDDGTEVGMWTLAPGIYQVTNENYNPSDTGGPTNIFVTPEDGIGMAIGGPAGTPTAVHTGLRYVGSQASGDQTTSIDPLAALPALETDLQNRHSMSGWIDGDVDDGHLFQFVVGTAGDFILGAQTGWEDASGNEGPAIKGVDIGFAVYDSAGTLVFTEQAWTGEYAETKFQTLAVGTYQLHVFNGIFDDFALPGPDSQFTCWIMDLTEAVRRNAVNGADVVTGDLSVGLRYDRVLTVEEGSPGAATDLSSNNLFGTDVELSTDGSWLYATSPGIDKVNAYSLVPGSNESVEWTTSTTDDLPEFTVPFEVPNINALVIKDNKGRTYIPWVDYTIAISTVPLSTADSDIILADSDIITADTSSQSNVIFNDPFVYGAAPDITITFSIAEQYYLHITDMDTPPSVGITSDTDAEFADSDIILADSNGNIATGRVSLSTNDTGTQLMVGVVPLSEDLGVTLVFDRMVEKFIAVDGQTDYRVDQNYDPAHLKVIANGVELVQNVGYTMDIGEGDVFLTTPSTAGEVVQIETNDFVSLAELEAPVADDHAGDNFGYAVDLCPVGCVLLVGMPNFDAGTAIDENNGIVYNYVNYARRFGTITSTIQNATVTIGNSIRIDDVNIFFSGTSLDSVSNDINNAMIPGVTADVVDGYLVITSDSRIDFDKLTVLPGRTAGTNTGFEDLGFDIYPLATTINSPLDLANERFGESVQISNDNQTVVVGSSTASTFVSTTFDNDTSRFDANSTRYGHLETNSGAASVFEFIPVVDETLDNMGQFVFAQQLVGDDISTGDLFGTSLAISDNLIVVGAPGDIIGNVQAGTIYNFTNDTRAKAWNTIRTQEPKIATESINKVYIYDDTTKLITNTLDYIDPVKSKLLGQAQDELDYLTSFDPAKYNFATNPDLANEKIHWTSVQLGRLWWDLSTIRYLEYEQIDAKYKFQNWGVYFPGSSIDVYEWVETDVLPSAYVAAGYDGVPKNEDDSIYTQISFINTQTGLSNISYFYWVKDKTEVDIIESPFRSITSTQVAQMIDNPKGTGIAYAEIIDQSSVGLVNVTSELSDDDMILHIDYDVIPNDNVIHAEYALIQEGGATNLPVKIINKLIDSLAGIDSRGLQVPDSGLPASSRLGIEIRPRQTMFINRPKAVEAMVLSVNQLLAQFRIVDIRTMPLMYTQEEIPAATSGEYDETVPTIETLQLIDVSTKAVGYKALVLSDSDTSNFWVIYTLDANKEWVASRVQAFDTTRYWNAIDWYETGFDATTTVNITLDTRVQLHTLETIVPGAIIKVLDNGNGQFELLQEVDGGYRVVGVEASTVEISSDLYDPTNGAGFDTLGFDLGLWDSSPQEETRRIVESILTEILIDELADARNELFFVIIRHILAEQSYVDWIFKSSFVSVRQEFNGLQQFPVFQRTTQTFLEDYINEIKPYRTKIREFLLDQRIMDTWDGDVTDFDQPAYYDFDLSRFRGPSGEQPGDQALLDTQPEYAQWNAHHKYYVGSISIEEAGDGYNDLVPPAVTISGGGGTGATAVAVSELGVIISITVTNPGTGYTTTPTVTFATGAGTEARAYAHLANDEVRKIKMTMKFDRVTYNTTVVDWEPLTDYVIGDILAHNGNAWEVTANFTSGAAFTSNNMLLVPLETFDNANDRTWAGYQPTPGMIDRDLGKLYRGIEYPGVQIVGPVFPGSGDFDSVLDGGELTTNFDGLRPGENDVDGGAFVGVNNVHGPEELIPGRVFETIDIQIYSTDTTDATDRTGFPGVCYRQFQNVGGEMEYLRISDFHSALLTVDLLPDDTTITVDSTANLGVPDPATQKPGVLFVNGERITYYAIDDINTLSQIMRGTQGTSIPDITASGARVADGGEDQLVTTATVPPRVDALITPWNPFNFIVNTFGLLPAANSDDYSRVGAKALVLFPSDPSVSQIVYQVQETLPSVYAWVRINAYTDIEWHDRDPLAISITDEVSLQASSTAQAVFLQARPGFTPDAP